MNYFIIGTIAIFLISGGLVNFLILPKYQEFQNCQIEIERKEIEIQSEEDYFLKLKRFSKEIEEHKQGLAKIDFAVPSNFSIINFFNFLQNISAENDLIIKGLGYSSFSSKPKTADVKQKKVVYGAGATAVAGEEEEIIETRKKQNKLQEITISFTVTGSYSSFKNFLIVLENSARLIDIEDISFSLASEELDDSSFSLTIKANSY